MSLFPKERKCAVCGKVFLGYEEWVFRRGEIWMCSNKCTRMWDGKKKARYRNRRLDKDERREAIEMLKSGMSPSEVAEIIGISPNAIYYYHKKLKAGAEDL